MSKKTNRKSEIAGLLNTNTRTHATKDHELEDVVEVETTASKRKKMKRYTVNFTPEENLVLRKFVLDAGEVTIAQLFRHIVHKIDEDADFSAQLISELVVQEG